nr:hypothetical protein Iba_chr02aCG8520 [Ipomoea batatas]
MLSPEKGKPPRSSVAALQKGNLRQGCPPKCSATDEHHCFVWPGEESNADAATNHYHDQAAPEREATAIAEVAAAACSLRWAGERTPGSETAAASCSVLLLETEATALLPSFPSKLVVAGERERGDGGWGRWPHGRGSAVEAVRYLRRCCAASPLLAEGKEAAALFSPLHRRWSSRARMTGTEKGNLRQGCPPKCSATDEHRCFVWPGEESNADAATNHYHDQAAPEREATAIAETEATALLPSFPSKLVVAGERERGDGGWGRWPHGRGSAVEAVRYLRRCCAASPLLAEEKEAAALFSPLHRRWSSRARMTGTEVRELVATRGTRIRLSAVSCRHGVVLRCWTKLRIPKLKDAAIGNLLHPNVIRAEVKRGSPISTPTSPISPSAAGTPTLSVPYHVNRSSGITSGWSRSTRDVCRRLVLVESISGVLVNRDRCIRSRSFIIFLTVVLALCLLSDHSRTLRGQTWVIGNKRTIVRGLTFVAPRLFDSGLLSWALDLRVTSIHEPNLRIGGGAAG